MKYYFLGLVIFVITIIINIILVKLHYTYFGEVALVVATLLVSIIYSMNIKNSATSRDKLKASLVVYLGFVILRMLPYLSYSHFSMPRALTGALIGGLVSFIIVYIILSFVFSKETNNSIMVYAVTDDLIANRLVNLLSNRYIEAYSIRNTNNFLGTMSGANINIMIKEKSNYEKALKEINQFFDKQTNKEP